MLVNRIDRIGGRYLPILLLRRQRKYRYLNRSSIRYKYRKLPAQTGARPCENGISKAMARRTAIKRREAGRLAAEQNFIPLIRRIGRRIAIPLGERIFSAVLLPDIPASLFRNQKAKRLAGQRSDAVNPRKRRIFTNYILAAFGRRTPRIRYKILKIRYP